MDRKPQKKEPTKGSSLSIKQIIFYSIGAFVLLVVLGYLSEWYF